ncbi:acyltransferase family protein [Streptomyces cinerochromogenes]|uniref:acyltransferase family protein n=1 Tax=Streptomyces cinerochromogenes TaxID=66422 RepID=UPI00167116AA|nr:acyltransferase [Streptomyces cinerochromogenes]
MDTDATEPAPPRLAPAPPAGQGPGRPLTARLDGLTGLRGVAALGVVFVHLNPFLPIPGTFDLFGFGDAGVPLFFVLSGFVLTFAFERERTPGRFYWRRFTRVVPLSVVITLLATLFMAGAPDTEPGRLLVMSVLTLLMVNAWVPTAIRNSPNPQSWTLSCEIAFYAILPFLAGPLRRRTQRQLAVLAGLAVVFGLAVAGWMRWQHPDAVGLDRIDSDLGVLVTMSPPATFYQFFLGLVVGAAVRNGWRPRVPPRVCLALVALVCAVNMVWELKSLLGPVVTPVFAVLIAGLAVEERDGARSWFARRPVVRLGDWSYALYMIHFMVILSISMPVTGKTGFEWPDARWIHLPFAVLAIAVSLVCARLLTVRVQQPIERRLRARWFPERVAPESAEHAST